MSWAWGAESVPAKNLGLGGDGDESEREAEGWPDPHSDNQIMVHTSQRVILCALLERSSMCYRDSGGVRKRETS